MGICCPARTFTLEGMLKKLCHFPDAPHSHKCSLTRDLGCYHIDNTQRSISAPSCAHLAGTAVPCAAGWDVESLSLLCPHNQTPCLSCSPAGLARDVPHAQASFQQVPLGICGSWLPPRSLSAAPGADFPRLRYQRLDGLSTGCFQTAVCLEKSYWR